MFLQKFHRLSSHICLFSDKPSQPGEIDIISVTKDCITIHWLRPEFDGGKEILGYWIEFRQAGESSWKKCNKERSKDRQFTMGGLMEATEYEFRVFAENETGLSRPRRTPMGIKTKLSGEWTQNSAGLIFIFVLIRSCIVVYINM